MHEGTQTHKAIEEAIRLGYTYDKATGEIRTPQGRLLMLSLGGQQRYPTVTFYCHELAERLGRKRSGMSIPAHKFAAYILFGKKVFEEGVQIRHLNGVMAISEKDLALGDAVDNMQDIPASVRAEAARKARSAQAASSEHRKFTDSQVAFIRNTARKDRTGALLGGELERLAQQFGTTPRIISGIIRGIMYAPKKKESKVP